MVIPLTHHKNSGYTELKVLGVYFSPAAGGGKIHNQIGILPLKNCLVQCAGWMTIINIFFDTLTI
ncbi:hypothetical protein [uncultured Ruminococcus sp.]|uniref:hypothetical protein n=1 Tax=uncultured Ruminococcus sp. TaxID=165186 RepID=UPI0025F3078A|nr:hypothetical protein [uncultured Ruminococcus sp.]